MYLFDTFSGFDEKDFKGLDSEQVKSFTDTSIDLVKENIGENIKYCSFEVGYFPDSIKEEHKNKIYSIVSLDCDLYEPMKAGLDFFYKRMPKGGLLMLHDYSSNFWEGSKKAIDEFCIENNECVILMPDKSGSVLIRKSF